MHLAGAQPRLQSWWVQFLGLGYYYPSTFGWSAWLSGRMSVSGQRSFAVLRSTCSWWVWVSRPHSPSLPLSSRTPWIQLRGLGECCELPSGSGGARPPNAFWAETTSSGGISFNDFPVTLSLLRKKLLPPFFTGCKLRPLGIGIESSACTHTELVLHCICCMDNYIFLLSNCLYICLTFLLSFKSRTHLLHLFMLWLNVACSFCTQHAMDVHSAPMISSSSIFTLGIVVILWSAVDVQYTISRFVSRR